MPQRRPRTCTRCGVTKPLGQFPKEPPTWICKQCARRERELDRLNEARIEWQVNEAERQTRRLRRAKPVPVEFVPPATSGRDTSKYKHGLTVGEYRKMVELQGGRCAICQEPPANGRRLVVDHDHETAEFRGLLCGSCNTALGFFKDDPVRMARAAEYVRDPPRDHGYLF